MYCFDGTIIVSKSSAQTTHKHTLSTVQLDKTWMVFADFVFFSTLFFGTFFQFNDWQRHKISRCFIHCFKSQYPFVLNITRKKIYIYLKISNTLCVRRNSPDFLSSKSLEFYALKWIRLTTHSLSNTRRSRERKRYFLHINNSTIESKTSISFSIEY